MLEATSEPVVRGDCKDLRSYSADDDFKEAFDLLAGGCYFGAAIMLELVLQSA